MDKVTRHAILAQLIKTHGDVIPVAALKEAGLPKSAYTHLPYWKGYNPGALMAADLGVVISLKLVGKQPFALVIKRPTA